MAAILDGTALARTIRARLTEVLARGGDRSPGLLLLRVGEDPASVVYVAGKEKASRQVGIRSVVEVHSAAISEDALLGRVAAANGDPAIDGILVQLPLPAHIDASRVARAIDPRKDVDGLHPENQGLLASGAPGLVSCTPLGVLALLHRYGVPLAGRHVVVLGRSAIVGRPLSILLSSKAPWGDATVTLCHSRSRAWEAFTRQADVVVAAMGRPETLRGEHLRAGTVVVDVGIHRLPGGEKARLVGDVHAESVHPVASHLSPVPGGVGPLTIAMLLTNTVLAFLRHGASADSAVPPAAAADAVAYALGLAGIEVP